MTEHAVISGTYSDLKFIKTRRVAQITIEVPLESAADIVTAFGTPDPNSEVWVAVARLTGQPKVPERPEKELTPGEKAKRHFEASCQDEGFMNWFIGWADGAVSADADPREAVKAAMHIQSANELLTNPEPWNRLWTEYQYRDAVR